MVKPMMKRIMLVITRDWATAGVSSAYEDAIAKITAKKNTTKAATPPIICKILIISCFVLLEDLNLVPIDSSCLVVLLITYKNLVNRLEMSAG